MILSEFMEKINESEEYEGIGIDDKYLHIKSGDLHISLTPEDIKGNSWENLQPYLRGQVPEDRLKYMARVCGYYSNVNNWNQSKIGELKDRRKGNYAID